MTDATAVELPAVALPPEQPSVPPAQWLKENLFSSWFNTVLTVAFSALMLWALRGLLNFTFSEERNWDAVRVNLRLLFTQAYPENQYARIWVSLGAILALGGLSLGLWASSGGVSMRKLSMWLMSAGGFLALCVLLREPSVIHTAGGAPARGADGKVLREAYIETFVSRGWYWLAALALLGAGVGIWRGLGEQRRRSMHAPLIPLVLAALGVVVASTWVYPWGHYAFSQGEFIIEPDSTVAFSTSLPWTLMWVILVASWLIGRALSARAAVRRLRIAVNLAWLALPFTAYWVVLRDPDIDWAHVWTTDLPMAVAFAAVGAVVLWVMTRSSASEIDRVVAALLVVFAGFHWLAAFFGWYPMLQKGRLSFLVLALFALAAPNFIGVRAQRLRLIGVWVGVMAALHYFATLMNSPSTIETPTDDFLGGFSVTLLVASFALLFSFPLGVLLALARTSRMPIFRVLATSFIETVRGVPLITILIFFTIMVQLFLPEGMDLSQMAGIAVGFTLFSSAYLAENVRGGLQSVLAGQYEASDAVGLKASQRTLLVVLPQALRVSIPPLVGQVIAVFKETSLIAIIGAFDFLRIANSVIPAQSEFLGVKREGLLFVSVVYWAITISMSKYSQRLERRVGLGER